MAARFAVNHTPHPAKIATLTQQFPLGYTNGCGMALELSTRREENTGVVPPRNDFGSRCEHGSGAQKLTTRD